MQDVHFYCTQGKFFKSTNICSDREKMSKITTNINKENSLSSSKLFLIKFLPSKYAFGGSCARKENFT